MARRISDEEIKLSILIDGNPAQKAILDLEKQTINYKRELSALEKQQKALQRQRKTDTDEYRANAAEIRRLTTAIDTNEAKLKELTSALKLSDMTMAQLRSKAQLLQATLRHLVPGTEDFERYNAELAQVNTRMDELRGHGQRASFSVGALADRFNRYAALGASVVAAGTGIVLSIQKILDFNGKLSDSQTNVMKTTGMTKQEVDELAKSFGALKTRTGRIELLGIAEIGGRLGIAKEEIQDFVKVMDKSAVALGDSFEGGPDVVAEKLGRIKGLYDELRDAGVEQAFEGVGSALNDLGADGTASEQNLAEFAQRVGSMPAAIKPTIQEALGLGAAFEESGLKAELAGNNYSKVITIAARDYKQFATIMRRPAEEIKNLINTNPTEFFFQFAQSLKGLDATDLAKVLDYLKLNDNEVKMVLGAASQNVELFRQKIKLAGDSMSAATSLTKEYDLKNSNLAATLDRVKKRVVGWFTSDSVVAFLESAVNSFAKFIGAVEDDNGTMTAFKNTLLFLAKAIAVVTAALITNVGWMKLIALTTKEAWEASKLYTLATKAKAVAEAASIIVTQGAAAVAMLFTGNIRGATQALRVMTATMRTTPWGLVLSLIAATVAAYVLFAQKAQQATQEQKAFNAIQYKVNTAIAEEKRKVKELMDIAKDETKSKALRLKAIQDLNAISPEYLGNLTLEKIGTQEATAAMNKYIAAIQRKIEMEELSKQIAAAKERQDEIMGKDKSEYQNWYDGMFDWDTEKARNTTATERREAEFNKEADLIKKLQERQRKIYEETDGAITGGGTGHPYVPDKDAEKAAADARKKRIAQREKDRQDLIKYQEEVNDLERRAMDERLALLFDEADKEEAIENENHKRRLADLKKQLVAEAEISSLDLKINDPKATPAEKSVWMHTKETWQRKNEQINKLIELEEGRHQLALETIDLKAEQKRITDLQEKFEAETVYRQTNHNYEMAALGDDAVAKEKLQNKFDQDELDRQKVHLEGLVREKQRILGAMNSLDIELLSPEQRRQMEQEIDALKLKISELLKAKSELQGKEGSNEFGVAAQNVFGDADILGFTEDQWEKTFASLTTLEQKLQALNMVVGGLQNLWASYNSFVSAGEDAQLRKYEKNSDAKKRKLKQQLDNGYISQAQYKKGLEQLDADLELKKAELEYKQAKRQKAMAIVDATINTAKGVTAAIPNLVLMGLAAAAGALQIATIARQPLPARGYEEGLYPEYVKREQDGKVFKSTFGGKTRSGMVNRPTHFLAGENGPEMIIDAAAYRQMSPETKNLLIRELRGIKGFEKGYYNNDVTAQKYEVPAASSAANAQGVTLDVALAIIQQNTAVMNQLLNDGVVAFFNKDPRDIK